MEGNSGWSPQTLCDHCLGRIFARVSFGLTNLQRGQIARTVLSSLGTGGEFSGRCSLCDDLFEDLNRYARACAERANGYQFSSFLIGSTFDADILQREKELQMRFGDRGESIKKEFDREVGKLLSAITGLDYSRDPEMYFHIDLRYDSISIKAKSLFVHGFYRKRARGLPQTRWIHGRGDTVESIIGGPLKEMSLCEDYRLHGAGREDVDVRMLGNGREFIIEGINPRIRKINLSLLRRKINSSEKVQVMHLSFTGKDAVERIKSERCSKVYDITAEGKDKVDPDRILNVLSLLEKKIIYQRTPLRVSKTRSDLVRERRVGSPQLVWARGKRFRFRITAEAGLYLKELVSGDRGRTYPSISSLYGEDFRVVRMDVVKILR